MSSLGSEDEDYLNPEAIQFSAQISNRDGTHCVVCGAGMYEEIYDVHIILKGRSDIWQSMKEHGMIPSWFKAVDVEPRNGIKLCTEHRDTLKQDLWFAKFMPSTKTFVFVNHSGLDKLEACHRVSLRLDISYRYCPLPCFFQFRDRLARASFPYAKDRCILIPPPPPVPLCDQSEPVRRHRHTELGHLRAFLQVQETPQAAVQPPAESATQPYVGFETTEDSSENSTTHPKPLLFDQEKGKADSSGSCPHYFRRRDRFERANESESAWIHKHRQRA